ncbi:mitotic checkpoint regulator, MAD2B-interacting-domain-containing protein [Xylaria digitata]|nr:mitotic checkpoint regulator, MAD2B-interacting-domain-containing protein [Xylaria digitata]
MGLVDYSDSESDTETITKPQPSAQKTTTSGSKKAFQKVVDRSKPGKILVNLPGSSSGQDGDDATTNGDEPPTKRARTTKGGAFSGFNSFLPPPKNVGKKPAAAVASSSAKGTNAPRPGVHLKTGAALGFSRNKDEDLGDDTDRDGKLASGGIDGGMNLPEPQSQQPTIPVGQKPADQVELVGKPLMFRPLSVSRKKPTKKPATKPTATTTNLKSTSIPAPVPISTATTTQMTTAKAEPPPPPPKKKISLFSISDQPLEETEPKDESNDVYEPLIDTDDTLEPSTTDAFAAYDAQYNSYAAPSQGATVSSASSVASNSLEGIVSDMNLSAVARRELFGRRGAPSADIAAAKVINFNTETEYAHNEVVRANGEQQTHNPVRAIAPGKHNLRQLVSQVHNQREALEESFAQGKAKQNEAGSRYGWR